jgi:hypothetical protein
MNNPRRQPGQKKPSFSTVGIRRIRAAADLFHSLFARGAARMPIRLPLQQAMSSGGYTISIASP